MFNNFGFNNVSAQKLTGATVLGEFGGQKITVSQTLSIIEIILKYIKSNFNVNERPYSIAIIVLNLMQTCLYNQNVGRPTKEQLKCLVDVFHEIEDLNAQTDIVKQENEKITNELKMIIEFLYRREEND